MKIHTLSSWLGIRKMEFKYWTKKGPEKVKKKKKLRVNWETINP